jgi:hypothetical protein
MAELHAPGWVAGAVRQGISARQGLNEYREAGGSIRDAIWYKLYAEQKVATESMRDEMTKPLNSIPGANEMITMTTKRATGYLQTIDIYTRVKGTDVVTVKPFMFSTDDLMSRGEALSKALTMMQQAVDEERYEEVLLGGVYTGTRIMTPGDIE